MEENHYTELLRKEIHKHLTRCNPAQSPRICALISTDQGYLQVEAQILNMVLLNPSGTIQGAIIDMETEMED